MPSRNSNWSSQLDQEPPPTLRQSLRNFRRFVLLIRSYWKGLTKSGLLAGAIGLVTMVPPYLSKLLIDRVYRSSDVSLMEVLVLGILAASVTTALMNALRTYYAQFIGASLGSTITLAFFNHVQHLRPAFFDRHRVGEVVSRLQDVRGSLSMILKVAETVFTSSVYLIIVPVFLVLLQWQLALIALVAIPLTVVISAFASSMQRAYVKRTAEAYAELNAMHVEVFSNVRALKMLSVEGEMYRRIREALRVALRSQMTANGIGQVLGSVSSILNAAATALVTWCAWKLILAQQMTLGDYIAFTLCIGYVYGPLTQIAGLLLDFQRSSVNLARMFEYLDEPPEQDPRLVYGAERNVSHSFSGEVSFRGVWSGYEAGQFVLRDISLHIPAGQVTAIVGPSGAGKSSLLRILCRYEQPEGGAVYVDGIELGQIALSDLRRQIAVVWQDVGLIRGTIWENLTLGAGSVAKEDVDEAVRICELGNLIASLPAGYDTPLAEWGGTLSSGQRQRLAIARALVRRAAILLLDEATANLDVSTEQALLSGVLSRERRQTIIFVTHRVATAARADRICVLSEGRVVGYDSHQALLERVPLYRQLSGRDLWLSDEGEPVKLIEAGD